GWKISIPEAVFQSRRGKRLEGEGVRVDQEIYYNLPEMRQGRDSWVMRAREALRREVLISEKQTGFGRSLSKPDSKTRVSK
uniref:hypothetical protein n=1 Tax=Pseudomonas viridiflava TaxID=33069 RepID=UPI00197D9BFD